MNFQNPSPPPKPWWMSLSDMQWLDYPAQAQHTQQTTRHTRRGVRTVVRSFNSAAATIAQWEEDPTIDADVNLDPEMWVTITAAQAGGGGDEIAVYGVVEENELVWIHQWRTGTSGNVSVEDNEVIDAMMAAAEEGYPTTNIHIHTHPNFSPFYSGTDEGDHVKHVQQALAYKADLDFFFVVFSGIKAVSRRYIVENEKVRWNQGFVKVKGIKLPTTLVQSYTRRIWKGANHESKQTGKTNRWRWHGES